jgi:hypothetical protein
MNLNELNKIIILTGHRKSGTTLLHRLFDGNNDILLYPVDLSVLYAYFPCFVDKKKTAKLLRKRLGVVIRKSLLDMNIDSADSIANDVVTRISDSGLRRKKDVIVAMARSWAEYNNANLSEKVFVFKETTQSIFIQDYIDSFGDIKMISVIRDPRDNYAAISAGVDGYYKKFGEGHLQSLASFINRAGVDLRAALVNSDKYRRNFMSIRFEDLVTDIERVMRGLCDFVEIKFTSSMLDPTILGGAYGGNNHDGVKFSGVSKNNIGRWKDRINKKEAMVIEYIMHDLIVKNGYELFYDEVDSQREFSNFYEWYNCNYFYHDSFK